MTVIATDINKSLMLLNQWNKMNKNTFQLLQSAEICQQAYNKHAEIFKMQNYNKKP